MSEILNFRYPSQHSGLKAVWQWKLKSRLLGVTFLIVSFVGCASYHHLPLYEQAVGTGLSESDIERIEVDAQRIQHPLLRSVRFDLSDGLSPDEASILAVLANPELRAIRDEKDIAAAQLLQAGILPNPQFSFSFEKPIAGPTEDTVNAYDFGLDWEISSLISHSANVEAAQKHLDSVDLSVAWQEWQVAERAKLHLFRLIWLEDQRALAKEAESLLLDNLAVVKEAVTAGAKTTVDLAAAKAIYQEIHLSLLVLEQEKEQEQFDLNRTLGLPPHWTVRIQQDAAISSWPSTPDDMEILDGFETRRLDLVALKIGYQSQEARVRKAVLSQFPPIGIGLIHARDTDGLITTGFGITADLPIFDRNQGQVAIERATRQKLYDEYVSRVFQARSELVGLINELKSLKQQIRAAEISINTQKLLAEAYQKAFEKHNVDIMVYYNVKKELIMKRLDLLRIKERLAEVGIAVEIESGQYFSTARNDSPPQTSKEETAK